MTTLTSQTRHWMIGTTGGPDTSSRVKTTALLVVRIVAAGMFVLSGTLKLTGAIAMVQLFNAIGVGQWFRYLTGTIEVVSAVLLLVPSLAFFGAVALAVTMVGAVLTHLFIVGGNPALAAVLLVTTAALAERHYHRRRAARVAPRR
jgi:putative oxidoreductase